MGFRDLLASVDAVAAEPTNRPRLVINGIQKLDWRFVLESIASKGLLSFVGMR